MIRTLAEELLSQAKGDPVDAAVAMAQSLMEDDPIAFKAGYTRENAVIAAAEYMGVEREAVEARLPW
jgi:hypothetical protein